MKHVKSVTQKSVPALAYPWEWFVNVKNGFTPGVIPSEGKPGYIDNLVNSPDSLDPTDVNDLGQF